MSSDRKVLKNCGFDKYNFSIWNFISEKLIVLDWWSSLTFGKSLLNA